MTTGGTDLRDNIMRLHLVVATSGRILDLMDKLRAACLLFFWCACYILLPIVCTWVARQSGQEAKGDCEGQHIFFAVAL